MRVWSEAGIEIIVEFMQWWKYHGRYSFYLFDVTPYKQEFYFERPVANNG